MLLCIKVRRGRLLFKQYIPGKAHKYGIKMYKLAATNGHTWNYLIYTDEQDSVAGLGHAETVVMNLLDGLSGCYRTMVVDNFFTSIPLAKRLLVHDTYLIGTLRSNHVASAKEFLQKKLKHGEAYGLQNKECIKLIMWKDKKRCFDGIHKTFAFSSCNRHWKNKFSKCVNYKATSCSRL